MKYVLKKIVDDAFHEMVPQEMLGHGCILWSCLLQEMVHTQQLLFWQHRSSRQAANADEAQGDTDNVANGQSS